MSEKMPGNIEVSSSKQKLLELEHTKKFLFHGSPSEGIVTLEPRQSHNVPNIKNPTEVVPDGPPGVAATPYVDMAIFRAIVNGKNIPLSHHSGFSRENDGSMDFRVSSKEVLDEAFSNKRGFVYVFDRKDFAPYNREDPSKAHEGMLEWRATEPIKPVEIIEVFSVDLPQRDQIRIVN